MLKPERDDFFKFLMPSSILGYSSKHFLLRCLQLQPEAAHKLCGKFDQSIAVPTNMLKQFQNSCGWQHRQQPLLHNSKWLFSRHKCVLSLADGKWGWNADAVRSCRYKHKEIWCITTACWLHTRSSSALPAIRTVFMPLLQGYCKPVISRRWKVMTGKKEA